jgi:hypothetical protein
MIRKGGTPVPLTPEAWWSAQLRFSQNIPGRRTSLVEVLK